MATAEGEGWADEESAILSAITTSQRGDSANKALNERVANYFNAQSKAYAEAGKVSITDELLFGNYDVSFVSTGDDQRGNPAGGSYRGSFGKLVFDSQGVYQHILPPSKGDTKPVVINYIVGKFLSWLYLSVILRGKATVVSPEERQKIESRFPGGASGSLFTPPTVCANFEPPLLGVSFDLQKPPLFSIRVGPPSSVVLDTPAVTPRVRLGRGSRGSLFVFHRITPVDSNHPSNLYQKVLFDSKGPLKGRRLGLLFAVFGSIVLKACISEIFSSVVIGNTWRKIAGVMGGGLISLFAGVPALFVGLFLIFSKGGILD